MNLTEEKRKKKKRKKKLQRNALNRIGKQFCLGKHNQDLHDLYKICCFVKISRKS